MESNTLLEVYEIMQETVKAFNKFGEELAKTLIPVVNSISKQFRMMYGTLTVNNARVYYLSRYAKKARVRKKNINRLIREATKMRCK